MALQTNVFRNGEWVTRTVSPGDLFAAASSQTIKQPKRLSAPPTYGLLTRTVIESPVFNWVLPVQLRSPKYNDVVFVGDNFVQVSELGQDIQLHDIARKQDFGSRIRNACVIGSPAHYGEDASVNEMKAEDDDVDMLTATSHGQLPPQLVALVLERGDLVFLFLEQDTFGQWHFVSHGEKIPDTRLMLPGYHLAVDPSSRYLALGCSETHFQIWNLESIDTLRDRRARGLPFRPVTKSVIPKAVTGVIHKIAFLSPGADNEENVVLTLILVHKGSSKLHRFEWELTDDVAYSLRQPSPGWALAPDYQMPLLMIPSTIRESFLLVTETSQAHWATLRNGQLEAQVVEMEERDQTELHIGNTMPLWTAWSRPWRLPEYHLDKDTIWMAREDGILQFLEIAAVGGISTNVILGEVKCKIDTAFACLYDRFADILITGGDSGPGAIWRAEARQAPSHIGTIPNWSPTVDIISTKPIQVSQSDGKKHRSRNAQNGESCSRQDQLFACAGRGQTGSIVEFRYGFEARVGFDFDLEDHVQQCWTMRSPANSPDSELCLLLAYPDKSTIVHIDIDTLAATFKSQEEVPFDLFSTTLAAEELDDGTIIQITTDFVTIVDPLDGHLRHPMSHVVGNSEAVVTDATARTDLVAISYYSGPDFRVSIGRVSGLDLNLGPTYNISGEVTCLAWSKFAGESALLVGVWDREAGKPLLMVFSTQISPENQTPEPIRLDIVQLLRAQQPDNNPLAGMHPTEAFTSMVSMEHKEGYATICIGSRSGEVITLALDPNNMQTFQGTCDKFGSAGAYVFPMSTESEPSSLFVCCDSNVFFLSSRATRGRPRFEKKDRVWVTGVESETSTSPDVSTVGRMRRNLSQVAGKSTLTMVSGSSIYFAELQSVSKPVLRHLPVLGTPYKVMYHPRLDVLVVAVLYRGCPTLRFIDPVTGVDLSMPTDSGGVEVPFITGLGRPGSRILALSDWNYEKDGRTWSYLVVSVRLPDGQGQVLVITASKDESRVSDGPLRIRFFTKLKRTGYADPVWSIATEAQGLLLCTGNTIQYEILDLEEKKLRKVKEHVLASPATSMEVVHDRLYVTTTRHSLEIVDFKSSPNAETMTRLNTDDKARPALHCLDGVDTSRKGNHQGVILVSDNSCGVWGMWAPAESDRPFKSIFLAELRASVKRFVRARTRMPWSGPEQQSLYGHVPSSRDGADILGLGIDGSLRHFTILDASAWRLLRFIQNLAVASPNICHPAASYAEIGNGEDGEFEAMDTDWDPEPKSSPIMNMHVDGDILQRCLDLRALEKLTINKEHAARLCKLLESLEGGKYTRELQDDGEMTAYVDLAYEVLEYYLSPVL
ncbi:hypothetical protein PFICI_04414 [Pestalotiopsis fici W106-1]|uniref:Uncharacterized protein n=1 Tax=Pestalotiopsis fici (strain W106-1 / CGMCC3.15140) TaxID=1229662 RepID=W3X8T9_PESFW|nr:uncharacterized protein PFICI_04414 [Pestalotiopsis fici W106-1]ETS82538.1 hypothetical protein PFICI_04414 [Pestalotiopsis fici W106-1]